MKYSTTDSRGAGFEPRPRKSEQTRSAILDSALEYLQDHSFRELTVGELMDRAGSSRPTFYQYFSDLPDLMNVLLDSLRDEVLVVAAPWFQGDGDPVPLLEESLAALVDLCVERGSILRAVAEAAVSNERLEQSWSEFLQSFDEAVSHRIEQHQAQGYIGPLPAHPVAVALNRLDAALLIEYFGRQPHGDRDEILATLIHFWRAALYDERGRTDSE